jgi:hypothetical protein
MLISEKEGKSWQRSGVDRRKNKMPKLKYLMFGGRRENARRAEDKRKIHFFDRYNTHLFAAIMLILFLSIVDALLTLYLIDSGSSELNPVMAYFLKFGPLAFVIAKYMLTSIGVVILLACKNVFLVKANIYTRSVFSYVIVAFSTVVAWEIYLILYNIL